MSAATGSGHRPIDASGCRHADAQPPTPLRRRTVVAVLVFHQGRLCLLRRSPLVGSDPGRWHCVTGFVEPGVDPRRQALTELQEETGLAPADLDDFAAGPVLDLPDPAGRAWRIHVFSARTARAELDLNWEHDAARWISWPAADATLALVPWLADLMDAITIPSTTIAA